MSAAVSGLIAPRGTTSLKERVLKSLPRFPLSPRFLPVHTVLLKLNSIYPALPPSPPPKKERDGATAIICSREEKPSGCIVNKQRYCRASRGKHKVLRAASDSETWQSRQGLLKQTLLLLFASFGKFHPPSAGVLGL